MISATFDLGRGIFLPLLFYRDDPSISQLWSLPPKATYTTETTSDSIDRHAQATQPMTCTKFSVPAEGLVPPVTTLELYRATPSFPFPGALKFSFTGRGTNNDKQAPRAMQKKLPGALFIFVAHNDVLFVGTEGWAQAAGVRVKVYSVLWDVHQ